jgi:universal stress protein A
MLRDPRMGLSKILCPVDFSDGAREALRVAAELARASSASLVVAHVMDLLPWSIRDAFQLAPGMIQDLVDSEQAELARWQQLAKEFGAREVASRYLTGTPWDQIATLARNDRTIDLVVMGTHSRTGVAHALLGSVTEKVVRHVPCPVLVVRPTERKN